MAGLLLLAQQGKLSIDDQVRKHIPELPDYGAPLTIRHMMNHTSGLRDWGTVAAVEGWPRGSRAHTHDHVLDIGCGFGDTTQQLASLVGPDGFAVGVDASPRFIEAARSEAGEAGVENVLDVLRGAREPELVLFGHGPPVRDTKKFVDFCAKL